MDFLKSVGNSISNATIKARAGIELELLKSEKSGLEKRLKHLQEQRDKNVKYDPDREFLQSMSNSIQEQKVLLATKIAALPILPRRTELSTRAPAAPAAAEGTAVPVTAVALNLSDEENLKLNYVSISMDIDNMLQSISQAMQNIESLSGKY